MTETKRVWFFFVRLLYRLKTSPKRSLPELNTLNNTSPQSSFHFDARDLIYYQYTRFVFIYKKCFLGR